MTRKRLDRKPVKKETTIKQKKVGEVNEKEGRFFKKMEIKTMMDKYEESEALKNERLNKRESRKDESICAWS